MAAGQRFRGRVSMDQLTVGGVALDPQAIQKLQDEDTDTPAVVPQPVPAKGTVAELTAALVAAGVLYEAEGDDDDE